MQPISLLLFVSITTYIRVSWAAPNEHCPPLGPVLPPPTHASSSPAVASSVATLQRFLDVYTAQFNHSAVAIGLKSIHEKDYILEYAYSPPNHDARGVQEVNSDTVFRIASVSKIFPVLGLLRLHGVSLDDPVTKYVPELLALNGQAREQSPIWTIPWDEITLGALASHLSGIGADLIFDYTPYGNFTPYGFPPVNKSKLLGCSGGLGLPECDRTGTS